MIFLFSWVLFRFHVKFQGCTFLVLFLNEGVHRLFWPNHCYYRNNSLKQGWASSLRLQVLNILQLPMILLWKLYTSHTNEVLSEVFFHQGLLVIRLNEY